MANTLKSQDGRGWSHDAEATYVADTVRSHPRPGSNSDGLLTAFASKGGGGGAFHEDGIAPTLSAHGDEEGGQPPAIAFNLRGREEGARPELDDVASVRASEGGSSRSYIADVGVRRLTPTECERLQGFPDDWTQLGETPDSRRYSALGDAVTVNVSEWIGERLLNGTEDGPPRAENREAVQPTGEKGTF